MPDPISQTDLALMKRDIEDLRKQNAELEAKVDELQRLDTSRVRAAAVALGGAVLALGTYIWTSLVGSVPR
jgi:hypothetical protein